MTVIQKRKSIIVSAAMCLGIILYSGLASATTIFHYTSSPSSWVGQGETVTVSPLDGFDFFVSRNFDQGVSFAINDFANNPDFFSTRWWYLDFAAPLSAPLQVGRYDNATRFPFQASFEPGLAFSGNGRGNNTLTGYFDVLEVVYSGSGEVLSFAADFVQFDEGIEDWWNNGSVRFNSDVPLQQIPEPSTYLLLGLGVAVLLVFVTQRAPRTTSIARAP